MEQEYLWQVFLVLNSHQLGKLRHSRVELTIEKWGNDANSPLSLIINILSSDHKYLGEPRVYHLLPKLRNDVNKTILFEGSNYLCSTFIPPHLVFGK